MRQCADLLKIFLSLLAAAATPAGICALIIVAINYNANMRLSDLSDLAFFGALFGRIAFTIALPHAVFLGLPAMLFFKSRGWTKLSHGLGCGLIIGVAAYFVSFPIISGKEIMFEDGLDLLMGLASVGLFGMSGGFAAWLTWKLLNKKPELGNGPYIIKLGDEGGKNESSP